jgi:hypothetical protein
VKILMRKTFSDSSPASNLNFEMHSLEGEPTIASLIVHNILQEVEIKQEEVCTCLLHRVSTLKSPHSLHLSRWWEEKVMLWL